MSIIIFLTVSKCLNYSKNIFENQKNFLKIIDSKKIFSKKNKN